MEEAAPPCCCYDAVTCVSAPKRRCCSVAASPVNILSVTLKKLSIYLNKKNKIKTSKIQKLSQKNRITNMNFSGKTN